MSSTLPRPAGIRCLDRGLVGAPASEQPGGRGSQRSPRMPRPLATSAFKLRFHGSRCAGTNAAMETRGFPGAGARGSRGRRGAQGNQSVSRELRASALWPGLEARFPARRREERGCGPVTGKDRACQNGPCGWPAPSLPPGRQPASAESFQDLAHISACPPCALSHGGFLVKQNVLGWPKSSFGSFQKMLSTQHWDWRLVQLICLLCSGLHHKWN